MRTSTLHILILTCFCILSQVQAQNYDSRSTQWGDCGGSAVELEEIEIPDYPVETTDSSEAMVQYNKWLLELGDNVQCREDKTCKKTRRSCVRKATGIRTDGSLPTPSPVGDGTWGFPDQGTTSLFITCKCVGLIAKEIEDIVIFDPLTEDENDDNFFHRVKLEQSIKIYPNPARNIINIDLSADIVEGQASIFIFNGMSQLVDQLSIDTSQESIKTINTSDLLPGIYYIRIRMNNELVRMSKFVIAEE